MELQPRFSQTLPLLTAIALCIRATAAHLTAAFHAQPPPAAGVPAFTTHVKLLPHPVPIGSALFALGPHATAALIGPFGTEDTVAVQINAHHPPYLVAHQLVPYTVSTSVPTAIPLKLFFTRFPPFIEAIVQRIQNYYSTYNHVENENYTASPPENKPVSTTTPMPTYTTIAPTLPADAGSQPENDQTDDTSAALSVTEPENNNR